MSIPRGSTNLGLHWAIILIVLLACGRCNALAEKGAPGVGFGLSADYGTVSIYYANGTIVNVAKVEGSSQYKRFMRSQDSSITSSPPLCSHLGAIPFLCHKDTNTRAAESMLNALKASVEAYLETPFYFADVTVPHKIPAHQTVVIRNSLEFLGLQLTLPQPLDAATAVGNAYLVGRDGVQMLLTVDYSYSGLIVTAFQEEEGILEELRVSVRPDLGANAAERASEHRAKIKAVVDDVLSVFKARLGGVVVFGDATNEEHFRAALLDALGEERVYAVWNYADPIFASAAGVAEISFEDINDPQFHDEQKPSWWCAWRSNFDKYTSKRDL